MCNVWCCGTWYNFFGTLYGFYIVCIKKIAIECSTAIFLLLDGVETSYTVNFRFVEYVGVNECFFDMSVAQKLF